ncbi:bifunctional 3,4-dihydroxy-2-butanone-4-phosphate synthase/GTP cyclohydrolase II [Chryseomicrobium sp. FSL W7-1435]|uniref:bifunctional 3,4-dihydroxy-2-butanone-4-phosphate synthase/GTP cyclohydrolase II n=1 Tax=Chryseomicrobium sp. FSL W7-1435 TaxID=2921704 RepID=UPI00315B32E9
MTMHEIEKAIEELKKGRPIIVVDDEDRENEGDFLALAEYATPELINFMVTEGRGLVCAPVTQEIAERLDLPPMVAKNEDAHSTAFTVSIDSVQATTGISAHERAETLQLLAHPTTTAVDFVRPGHIFPLIAKNGGVLERPGHTEAAVDLARLCGAAPVGIICEIMNPDGSMARLPQLEEVAEQQGLVMISIEQLCAYRIAQETTVARGVEVAMPTKYGTFRAVGFTGKNGKEHMALIKGELDAAETVTVRIHSECLTGDVFGSQRCDCGPQLDAAIQQIEELGAGVILYMRQEGRGIGLLNKLETYSLQEQGYDTVEANHKLGFADDLREYREAADILKSLGTTSIRLLTNNPRKLQGLESHGIQIVERIALELPANKSNENYLKTKKSKLNHILHL